MITYNSILDTFEDLWIYFTGFFGNLTCCTFFNVIFCLFFHSLIADNEGTDAKDIKWNAAPTLLEQQRENLTARLRREFGLGLPEDHQLKLKLGNYYLFICMLNLEIRSNTWILVTLIFAN